MGYLWVALAINDYEFEIDALYEAVSETTQLDISPPVEWDEKETLSYVRKVVHSILKKETQDNDDIFQSEAIGRG